MFKTVSVQYPTTLTKYTFMTDEDCKVGDKAVVFTNGNWNVVTIIVYLLLMDNLHHLLEYAYHN